MNRFEVIAKLNKLKAFLERDCGVESDNAQRIAQRLIREHNILANEFSYFWHADPIAQKAKSEEEAKSAQARKDFADMMNAAANKRREEEEARREKAQTAHRERAQRESAEAQREWVRMSYSSFMRKALLDLLRNMAIKHRADGAKIEACFVSRHEKDVFDSRWKDIKEIIQTRLDKVLRDTCEEIISNRR